jgi:hypothetical protein
MFLLRRRQTSSSAHYGDRRNSAESYVQAASPPRRCQGVYRTFKVTNPETKPNVTSYIHRLIKDQAVEVSIVNDDGENSTHLAISHHLEGSEGLIKTASREAFMNKGVRGVGGDHRVRMTAIHLSVVLLI